MKTVKRILLSYVVGILTQICMDIVANCVCVRNELLWASTASFLVVSCIVIGVMLITNEWNKMYAEHKHAKEKNG